ncbi:MAG: DUF4837 family protein [Saprospiraceae bacterium]
MRYSAQQFFLISATLLLLSLTVACSSGDGKPVSFKSKPVAYGNVNRVNIVIDDVLLEGQVRDSLSYYYEQAYPLMPQPESIYDLNIIDAGDLNMLSARKELRTYVILADLNDMSSATTKLVTSDLGEEKMLAAREDYRRGTSIVTDRWANDQLLIYLFAEGPDELAKLVAQSFPAASKRIEEADRTMLLANTYQSGHAKTTVDSLRELVGISLDVPIDYQIARAEENFVWLRRDLSVVIQNIMVTSVPYVGEDQISVDSAVVYRNIMGKMAVRSDTEGSYMTTNDRDLPVIPFVTQIDGKYAFEARGIWEMTDDFLGGAFFTYLIPAPVQKKLYVIDVFTFAPGKGKRNYMQQLEVIARTAKW